MQDGKPIPSPRSPKIWQTIESIRNPFDLISRTRKECGDIFKIRIAGLGDCVFVCTPELASEMFKAPAAVLAGGEVSLKFSGYLLGENSLFTMDGDLHQERRRLIYPHLTGHSLMSQIGMMERITEEGVRRWLVGKPFCLLEEVDRFTLETIISIFLGPVSRETLEKFCKLSRDFFDKGMHSPLAIMKWLQWDLGYRSPWGRVLLMRKKLYDAWGDAVDSRFQEGDAQGGVLAHMVRKDKGRLSREALIHEMVTITFGAQEAMGKILAWTILGILGDSRIYQTVVEEIDSVLGGRPVEVEDLARLRYLDAAIKEGGRYRPLGPFTGIRVAKEDFYTDGYVVPRGMLICHAAAELVQDPIRFDKPREYNPENFYDKKIEAFRFNLFGGGAKMCIGKRFAEVQMKVALATLFQKVELSACQKQAEPVRHGLLYFPSNARVAVSKFRET